MTDMQLAADNFYKYDNAKAFILEIMNAQHTLFIEALSQDNKLSPQDNARLLAQMVTSYIVTSYTALKYFGIQEGKTLEDYIYKNPKTPRRVVNYIFTDLRNRLTPMGYFNAVNVLLQQYIYEGLCPALSADIAEENAASDVVKAQAA